MNGRLLIASLGLAALLAVAFYFATAPSEPIDTRTVTGTIGAPSGEVPESATDADSWRWLDPNGNPLPFREPAEVEAFLLAAEVISRERISEGINGVDKLLLEHDGVRAHAAFRDVRNESRGVSNADGVLSLGFKDNCLFEVAAYRLSRKLALDNVPPTVQRTIRRRRGTLQLWIEDAFTEKQRLSEKLRAPEPEAWQRQVQTMYLFDRLIGNQDRNQGNILVDGNWKLWMIDHTRAFRTISKPPDLKIVLRCERRVWERLQQLDLKDIRREMKGVLSGREIRSLFSRRDAIVNHLRRRIERLGETAVLI